MPVFIPYLLTCALVGAFGRDRTIGFWGFFFLSVFVTPIGGWIGLLVTGKETRRERAGHAARPGRDSEPGEMGRERAA